MNSTPRIRFSILCFGMTVLSTVAMSPLFGNFTPERLPVLLVIAIIAGFIWGFIAGTLLRIP